MRPLTRARAFSRRRQRVAAALAARRRATGDLAGGDPLRALAGGRVRGRGGSLDASSQVPLSAGWLPDRPGSARQLQHVIQQLFDFELAGQAPGGGHAKPLAYLAHTFFDRGDAIVWAPRGGGKTMLGAIATLMDMLYKPGIQIRVLGGSLEQSARMHRYITALIERVAPMSDLLDKPPTQRLISFRTGSAVELLAQSQRSVRGQRVHKLRCDEIEEFDPEVWRAAQLVTRSGMCQDRFVAGAIDVLSTMHRPYGLMAQMVSDATTPRPPEAPPPPPPDAPPGAPLPTNSARGSLLVAGARPLRAVFRWSAMEVIERCPPARVCETCPLWPDCQGMAREASGHLAIDDLIRQKLRSSQEAWNSEVLCLRPRREDCVYPMFAEARHVRAAHPTGAGGEERCIAGMDFGIRSPLAMLWALVQGQHVLVTHEYLAAGLTLERHLEAIAARSPARPAWIGVDPAGLARNAQTGLSDAAVLRGQGQVVRARQAGLREGIERVRARLDRDTLAIHPRCQHLIQALRTYHFDPDHAHRETPVKDGPDHIADALRYLIVNLDTGDPKLEARRW